MRSSAAATCDWTVASLLNRQRDSLRGTDLVRSSGDDLRASRNQRDLLTCREAVHQSGAQTLPTTTTTQTLFRAPLQNRP
jgi:hypothetical protein